MSSIMRRANRCVSKKEKTTNPMSGGLVTGGRVRDIFVWLRIIISCVSRWIFCCCKNIYIYNIFRTRNAARSKAIIHLDPATVSATGFVVFVRSVSPEARVPTRTGRQKSTLHIMRARVCITYSCIRRMT